MNREGLQIIDYGNPAEAKQVATWHVPGQIKGEQYGPLNRNNPDGKPQLVQCHEINYHNDRPISPGATPACCVLDIKDRTAPKLLATYDYVPPYHGGFLGAAHSSLPIVRDPNEHPDIVVHTDEIFDCPQGFGRILDVSDLTEYESGARRAASQRATPVYLPRRASAGQVRSGEKEFVCPGTPVPNRRSRTRRTCRCRITARSPGLLTDEGIRVLDISNPSAPRFTGHFLSPRFAAPEREDRHTREISGRTPTPTCSTSPTAMAGGAHGGAPHRADPAGASDSGRKVKRLRLAWRW